MLFALHTHQVLILSFKLDNSLVGRYLSLQDNEFVDCVVADIKQFVIRSRTSRSVLIFPPVNNYRRFLIHKVSEEYSDELCTFSIGQGHGRRTVVCFRKHLIRDLNQPNVTVDSESGNSQAVKRLGAMGVDRQHLTGQGAATHGRENSVKRAKAVPAVGIYRPPAARRSEGQAAAAVASPVASVSHLPVTEMKEAKPERARPARQRRPDIQVYVPRAKRLSCGEQDKVTSASASTSSVRQKSTPSVKTKGSLHSRTVPSSGSSDSLPDHNYKSKMTLAQSCNTPTAIPSLQCSNNMPDVSRTIAPTDLGLLKCSKDISNSIDSDNFSCDNSDMNRGLPEVLFDVHLASVEPIRGMEGIYMQNDLEEVGVGRGISRRGSKNSTCASTPSQSGCNTPTLFMSEKQDWDQCNNVKHGAKIVHCESDIFNSADFSNNYQESCDTTHLISGLDSKPVHFRDNFLEDVPLGHNLRLRSSKSSCSSTSENSGRNTPSSLTDNGGQTWDYFSEIKNATNSSQNEVLNCEMDTLISSKDDSVAQNSFAADNVDVVMECGDSDSKSKGLSDGEELIDKNYNNGDREINNVGGTSVPSSADDTKQSDLLDDSTKEDILLSDKCHGCKKDENDDCRTQEEQNRKNRRIIRGNFMSDVLIISDPESVVDIMPTLTQSDSCSGKTSPTGVLNKKKKVQHKGESLVKVHSEKTVSPSSSNQNPVSLNLNPDECTWDMMFDDNGDCLDPKLMEELTSSVGSVTIEKPQSDYRSYQSRLEMMLSGAADDEFSHVLEIYNFPAEFRTNDLLAVFSPYMKSGFEIKWVDDTHALGVFSSSLVAAEVLAANHPFIKTRPLNQATHESRMKARRSAEFLQPYRARPETCAALARRLVTGALGVKLNTTPEEREAERKILKEAREKRRLAARQRDEAWEGTLGEK